MISQAMEEVGERGVITIEEAAGIETELNVVEGMNFDKGYVSPYFVTNAERMTVELDDTYILLHQDKLTSMQGLLPVLEKVGQTGKPLVIIAEDVDGEALATPWWSTGCAAASRLRRPRPRPSATGARPCSRTSPCSPAAR